MQVVVNIYQISNGSINLLGRLGAVLAFHIQLKSYEKWTLQMTISISNIQEKMQHREIELKVRAAERLEFLKHRPLEQSSNRKLIISFLIDAGLMQEF